MKQDSSQLEIAALQRLQKISAEMAGELELDRLLTSIMRSAADLLNSYYAHLYRYHPDQDVLISWTPLELPEGTVALELGRGEGAAGTVLATGRSLRVDSYDSWVGRTDKWPRGITGPNLHVPVRHGQRFLAVLTVGRRPGDQPYTKLDQELLELLANQAAVSISNARLYEEAKRSADEFAKLYDTSLDLISALNLEQVLEAILQRASDLLGVRSANLRVYDAERRVLVPLMPYRQYGEIGQIAITPGEGVSGKAFSNAEPVVVDDYDSWEGRSSQYPAGLIARSMGVPLKLGNEVTGVLTVERTADKPPFGEQEVRLLSLFANQAALAISNAQLYRDAERRSREISHLYDTSLDITALLELNQVLDAVLQRTTDLVEAQVGEVVVYDEQKGIITDFLSLDLGDIGMPLDVHRPGDAPSGLDALVIRELEPVRVEDYDRWPERVADAPIGLVGPMIGVPILHQERILGSLSLSRKAGSTPFSDEDEQRLVLFANQAAVAIQNARQVEELERLHTERLATERLNAQLETAKAVQAGLLPPKPPEIVGWELGFSWRPALQIGGDFYDFIDLGDGKWGIVVGDVADKGIPAAVFMSVVLSLMRTHAADNADPNQVLETVNRKLVSGSHSGIFVTVAYGVLDPSDSTFTVASAGHNPILVRKAADGTVEPVNPDGALLGVESDPGLRKAQVKLEPGDLAILYTDGVTEAMDPDGRQFGSKRLEAFLQSDLPGSARQVAEALDQAIAEHVADGKQSDDITHIVVRALG